MAAPVAPQIDCSRLSPAKREGTIPREVSLSDRDNSPLKDAVDPPERQNPTPKHERPTHNRKKAVTTSRSKQSIREASLTTRWEARES